MEVIEKTLVYAALRSSMLLIAIVITVCARAGEMRNAQLATYAARINYFNRLCPQEKVYLHLDNTAYFQGETIWFAATVVNASDLGEADSKVLYVELLSPTGVVLKQQKLKVVEGRCHGCFPLVDTSVKEAVKRRGAVNLPSGYYQLRAYTRAMLNFDEVGIYSRVIPVYTLPKNGAYETASVTAYPYLEEGRPKTIALSSFNITFYPEGGHLVKGVESRIAFKAIDEHGEGVDIDALTDSRLRPIAFSRQHDGMGCFTFVSKDEIETVNVMVQGRRYTADLPKAEPAGCVLTVDGAASDTLTAGIQCVGIPDSLLAYTVMSGGNVVAAGMLMSATTQTLRMARRSLPTGVCVMTVFGQDGAVYAQRMFFSDGEVDTLPVQVTFSQEEYRPFHPVDLKLQTAGGVPATFSLSVRDAADYGTSYSDDIRTYLLLSSELKGLIEDPAWYFGDASREERTAALDLLMMVQGWTRYNWRQMAGVEPFDIRHYTETQLVVDGWAFSRIKEVPLEDTKVSVSLYSPDRQYKQKTTVTTDSLGYWSVGLDDFEGEWDLFYSTRQNGKHKGNSTTRIRLARADKPAVQAYQPIETFLPDHGKEHHGLHGWTEDDRAFEMPLDAIVLDEVEVKAEQLYVDYGTFHAYDIQEECNRVYDEGDYAPDYDDYLLSKGICRTPEGALYMDKYNLLVCRMDSLGRALQRHPNRNLQVEHGLEYIQSIIVYDPMRHITRLPCVREFYAAALSNSYGVVIPGLFNGDQRGGGKSTGVHDSTVVVEIIYAHYGAEKLRQKNSRQTTFKGYDPPVEFYAPTYPNGPIQGDKDYRRTLYWNPEVRTDSTGSATVSFYNNGYSRSLTVSAEGLTQDGVPILNE